MGWGMVRRGDFEKSLSMVVVLQRCWDCLDKRGEGEDGFDCYLTEVGLLINLGFIWVVGWKW